MDNRRQAAARTTLRQCVGDKQLRGQRQSAILRLPWGNKKAGCHPLLVP